MRFDDFPAFTVEQLLSITYLSVDTLNLSWFQKISTKMIMLRHYQKHGIRPVNIKRYSFVCIFSATSMLTKSMWHRLFHPLTCMQILCTTLMDSLKLMLRVHALNGSMTTEFFNKLGPSTAQVLDTIYHCFKLKGLHAKSCPSFGEDLTG